MDANGRLVEVQRAMAKNLIDPNRRPLPTRPQYITRRMGVVTAINVWGGRLQAVINTKTVDGIPFLDSYSPKVGDLCWFEFAGGKEPICVGTEAPGPWGGIVTSKWRVIGTAGEPAFQNYWANYSGYTTDGQAAFRKVGEIVFVHAIIGVNAPGTANTVAFELPQGYRPRTHHFFMNYNGTQGYVLSSGALVPVVMSGALGANLYVCNTMYAATN